MTAQLAVNDTVVGLKIEQNQAIGRVLHRKNFFLLALKTKKSIKVAKTIMHLGYCPMQIAFSRNVKTKKK